MQRRLGPVLVVALAMAGSGPALAHPHVWIENVTTFVFEGERLTALRLTWAFDEFFGTAIVRRFDANRNGVFEAEENRELEQGAFANLKEYGYFTHIRVDGKPLAIGAVTDFQGSVRNGQLVYRFTVPLPAPLDPAAQEVSVAVFDESYFVEVSLEPTDPVRFERMPAGRCAFAVREGEAQGLAAFTVAPFQTVTLACPKP